MKSTILLLVCILGLGVVTSCNNDDDNTDQQESLDGTWNLTNVRGSLLGVDLDYNEGEVIWNFNQDNILVVENNIMTTGPEDIYSGLDSGTYAYNIQVIDDLDVLFVENREMGFLVLSNKNLKIDDRATDGLLAEFER